MIKRIIFDLDGTLVNSNFENLGYYLSNLDPKLDKNIIKDLNQYFFDYEKENKVYSYDGLYNFLNKRIPIKYNDFLKMIKYSAKIEPQNFNQAISIISILSQRYEIYILTNWFRDIQISKLKTIGIYQYIDKLISGEEILKPNKKAYYLCSDNLKKEECLFIGDNYIKDVKAPRDLGYNAIMLNNNLINNLSLEQILKKIEYINKK